LFLLRPARKEWEEYLKLETLPQWRAKARAHIAAIDVPPPFAAWPQERLKLAEAALRDDAIVVKEIVKRFPHPARLYAMDELMPAWADAMHEGRNAEAQDALKIAHAVGAALDELQGDKFIFDLTDFIENADTRFLPALIDAHRAYRNGQEALDRYEIEKALVEFNRAFVAFAQIKDKAGEASSAVRIAFCYYALIEFDKAQSLLDRIYPYITKRSYLYLNGWRWVTVGLINFHRPEPTQAI